MFNSQSLFYHIFVSKSIFIIFSPQNQFSSFFRLQINFIIFSTQNQFSSFSRLKTNKKHFFDLKPIKNPSSTWNQSKTLFRIKIDFPFLRLITNQKRFFDSKPIKNIFSTQNQSKTHFSNQNWFTIFTTHYQSKTLDPLKINQKPTEINQNQSKPIENPLLTQNKNSIKFAQFSKSVQILKTV